MCRFMEWVECCGVYGMRVGEIEMGRRSREGGKTHDVYRVWWWWVYFKCIVDAA